MTQDIVCPCSPAGQHRPAEPGSEKRPGRRKIAFLTTCVRGREVEVERTVATIGDIWRTLYVLHSFLFDAGNKDGAALATVLASQLEEQHEALRALIELETDDA